MNFTNYREIDKLGRIVISKDIRKHLDLSPGDVLEITADDTTVSIKKAEPKCVFCGSLMALREYKGKHICEKCIGNILYV